MNETPTHLDLFSGIGGFALAAQWAGFETIGFCEIDKYCQRVLVKNCGAQVVADSKFAGVSGRGKQRFGSSGSEAKEQQGGESSANQSGYGGEVRITPDIFNLGGRDFAGVTLITGGFPCQPFSVAGKRRGAADDRAIWPQMFRVIRECCEEADRLGLRRPWVLGENVTGIIGMELDAVLSDLEGIGYATRTFIIPACAVDAKHRRNRVWIVAHSERDINRGTGSADAQESEREQSLGGARSWGYGLADNSRDASDNESKRFQGVGTGRKQEPEAHGGSTVSLRDCRNPAIWEAEPDVGRVVNGIPSRVDRLKGLGNAIVPQVAYQILKEIRKLV